MCINPLYLLNNQNTILWLLPFLAEKIKVQRDKVAWPGHIPSFLTYKDRTYLKAKNISKNKNFKHF